MALGVEYDGARFYGWQRQLEVPSVQACLEEALSVVADHPVTVICAGRTDAGVHALEQVAHFETGAWRSERSWMLGTNVNLPPEIAVRWVRKVDDRFHARFSALARHYRYRILVRPTRSPLERDRVAWTHRPLDVRPMRRAAAALVGEHDFSSFRAIACQARSPVRHVHYLEMIGPEGADPDAPVRSGLIELRIGANGFLHHMVRNIAGVLMAIGRGDAAPDWTGELLRVRDRTRAGVTAPPGGLYFARAEYPACFDLPIAAASGASPGASPVPDRLERFADVQNPG